MPLEMDDIAVVALSRAFGREHQTCCYPTALPNERQIAAKRMIEALWDAGFEVVRREDQ